MFKIFACRGVFTEGIPLIIAAVVRLPNLIRIEGHVLIMKPGTEAAIFLPPQRTNLNISPTFMPEHFNDQQISKMQLSWSKNQLVAWLYQQRNGGYIPEQTFDWEEVRPQDLIVPLVVTVHSNNNSRAGIIELRNNSNCSDLIDYLNSIRDMEMTIENVQ